MRGGRIAESRNPGVQPARRFGVLAARATLNRGGATAKPPIIRTRRIAEECPARGGRVARESEVSSVGVF